MKLNVSTSACDQLRLEAFLSGDLSDAQEREFAQHLNSCEQCRRSLAEQAAEPEAWREAEQLLRPSQFDGDDSTTQAPRQPLQIQNVLDALNPTDDPEKLGRLGGYEVSGVVGAGGMGVVLKASDPSLDRTVAIKVLAPHLASSGAARKRFAREAKAAAAVLHPNVIAIHSVSNDESLPYLVMPYVRGTSLQKRLDQEGPLPLQEILRIGAQIAAGLAAAHGQGLVHRDIKPANILLEDGVERVTITDFGLARAVDDATITHSGVIAGTPQFMSPEQARGEPVDPRSDLFSLGSVLYAICTGRPPFRAETSYGVLRRITDDEPTSIRELNPEIPEWLCRIIGQLMAKRAADRFASAGEVAELLEACLAHVQHPAAAPLPPSLISPPKPRFIAISPRSGVIAMIATLGFALLAMFAWQMTGSPDAENRPGPDSAPNSNLHFTQPTEVVLSMNSSKFMLDLDTGKTMDPPATIRPEQKLMDLYTDQVQPYHYPKELIGQGLRGLEVKEADWDATPAEVVRALSGKDVTSLKQMDLGPEKHPTYFFQTSAGTRGVLQLRGIVEDPRGIRLRYKTVSAPAAEEPSNEVAPDEIKAAFLRQTGDTPAANQLFERIAAHKHLLDVLTEAQQFPERRGILYAAELWRVWREAAGPDAKEGGVPAPAAAVCFYLGCDPATADALRNYPVPPDAKEGFRTHETLILSMAVRMELADAGRKEPFARLIAGWTAARSDPWVRAHAIETAREFGLAAMVSVVRQIASDNQTEARFRAPAITLLAELGGQDERPLLRQLLGNGGECYSRKLTIKGEDAPTATAQIRDVALGCLLIRDGVDLQTAGFDELDYLYREPLKPHEYFRLSPFGFFSDEKRNAAHAKFAALRMPDAPPGNSPKAAADQAAELKRLRQFAIQHRIGAIACSAKGELIAITNSDVTFPLTADWKPVVEVLDATTGKTLASLPLATDAERELIIKTEGLPHFEVGPLTFSPDGKVLAVSTGLGQVKLFNARSGELIRSLDDEKARLAEAKSPEKFKTFPRAMGAVRSLAFSPEGNLLAMAGASFDETSWDLIERGGLGKRSSSGPGRLKVWDIKTGELKHDLAGHSQVFGVAFAPDGSWLASVGRWSTATSEGNGLLLWDLKTQAIHRTIMIDANGSTHAVVFSPQKKLAAIGSIQFDKENDTRSSRIQLAYPLSGITEWKQTIDGGALPRAFLPDGKQLVALCERKSIRFFDVETGQMKREIKAADSAAGGIWVELAVAQQAGIMVIAGATHESRGVVEIWGAADRHDE